MLHFRRRPSRFVCRFLGSITKSKKPSVYVDGVKESGKGQGSSQTGLNSSKHVVIQITRWSKQGATIISTLLMKTIVIRESFSRRPVHCQEGRHRNNTPNTLTLLCLLMILGDSLHKRSTTFAQSWIELTPHQISLTTRPGVASKNIRMLAHPSLTSSLYRLKV